MVPEIGLMIAAYVVARCLDMIAKQVRQFEQGFRGILSVLVIVASLAALGTAVLMGMALMFSSIGSSSLPNLR